MRLADKGMAADVSNSQSSLGVGGGWNAHKCKGHKAEEGGFQ